MHSALLLACLICTAQAQQWTQQSAEATPLNSDFEDAAPRPTRNSAAFCLGNDHAYIYGGKHGGTAGRSNELWLHGPSGWRWITPRGVGPGKISGSANWITTDTLWIYGGRFDQLDVVSSSLFSYKVGSHQWIDHGQQLQAIGPRYGTISWQTHEKTYIYGGRSVNRTVHQDLWTIDHTTLQWTLLSAQNPPGIIDDGIAAFHAGSNTAYIFGGENDADVEKANTLWTYNIALQAWSATQLPRDVSSREDHLMFIMQDHLYIMLGKRQEELVEDHWVHHIPSNQTSLITSTGPSIRWGAAYCINPARTRVFVFGGNQRGQLLNDVWVYGSGSTQTQIIAYVMDNGIQIGTLVLAVFTFIILVGYLASRRIAQNKINRV